MVEEILSERPADGFGTKKVEPVGRVGRVGATRSF